MYDIQIIHKDVNYLCDHFNCNFHLPFLGEKCQLQFWLRAVYVRKADGKYLSSTSIQGSPFQPLTKINVGIKVKRLLIFSAFSSISLHFCSFTSSVLVHAFSVLLIFSLGKCWRFWEVKMFSLSTGQSVHLATPLQTSSLAKLADHFISQVYIQILRKTPKVPWLMHWGNWIKLTSLAC